MAEIFPSLMRYMQLASTVAGRVELTDPSTCSRSTTKDPDSIRERFCTVSSGLSRKSGAVVVPELVDATNEHSALEVSHDDVIRKEHDAAFEVTISVCSNLGVNEFGLGSHDGLPEFVVNFQVQDARSLRPQIRSTEIGILVCQ